MGGDWNDGIEPLLSAMFRALWCGILCHIVFADVTLHGLPPPPPYLPTHPTHPPPPTVPNAHFFLISWRAKLSTIHPMQYPAEMAKFGEDDRTRTRATTAWQANYCRVSLKLKQNFQCVTTYKQNNYTEAILVNLVKRGNTRLQLFFLRIEAKLFATNNEP